MKYYNNPRRERHNDGTSLFDLPPECIRNMMEITARSYPSPEAFRADLLQKYQEAKAELERLERLDG